MSAQKLRELQYDQSTLEQRIKYSIPIAVYMFIIMIPLTIASAFFLMPLESKFDGRDSRETRRLTREFRQTIVQEQAKAQLDAVARELAQGHNVTVSPLTLDARQVNIEAGKRALNQTLNEVTQDQELLRKQFLTKSIFGLTFLAITAFPMYLLGMSRIVRPLRLSQITHEIEKLKAAQPPISAPAPFSPAPIVTTPSPAPKDFDKVVAQIQGRDNNPTLKP